ncbi:MAG TPA: response regulator [Bryobacteraceae bacterium]|nr:response regulator [Bryobacteraceae bacterium]
MRILGVDDNAENLYLVETIVRSHGHEMVGAHNGAEALEKLAVQSFDLIVSDILMPVMDGFQFCRAVKYDERLKRIPFVFYTATYTAKQDEKLGLALGASRFIVQPVDPDKFLAIIEQVVHEGESGKIPVPVSDLRDDEKTLSLYNERLVRKLERKTQQLESAQMVLAKLVEDKDREIAQRRQAEEAVARSEEQLRLIWDASMDGLLLTDREGIILRANPALARIFAKPLDTLPGQPFTCWHADDSEPALSSYREQVVSHSVEPHFEVTLRRWDGEQTSVEGSSTIIDLPGGLAVFSVLRDVTQRKRFEQERAALEEQLRQAQKLESVGRLAGGIAHDFNNLLTVINGYSDLVLRQLHPGDPLREKMEEIRNAGDQASGLTRQLLAFSRKQARQPQLLDLNRLVEQTRPMVARLVGEDVELLVNLHPGAAVIYADPRQLEQVLMNLVVNSRDAMPRGGKLRIETSIVEWSRDEVQAHPRARAGRYVVLTVSDNGEGMTEETRRHIFEPFFTTKEAEKGTGLGLSMAQGIVGQSDGFIEVQSELGRGSIFRIYLPGAEGTPSDSKGAVTTRELRGTEAVLVVEDQAEVRTYVAAALRSYGYRIFQAADTESALLLCEREQGHLDLLLTDVVLPTGSGKELADQIRDRWSGIRVLYMSGYTDDATMRHGLPAQSANFIQKPFRPEQLALKVREILTARSSTLCANLTHKTGGSGSDPDQGPG